MARGFRPSFADGFKGVIAGVQDPITSMVAGRCRVEGDVMLAAQIEPMFSAR